MKKISCLLFILPFLLPAQQKITLEEIWGKYAFMPKTAKGFNVMKDGKTYLDLGSSLNNGEVTLETFDLRSANRLKEIVNANDIRFENRQLDLSSYELSPNEDKLLLFENMEYVYRRSPKANYFVFDITTKKITRLSEGSKQFFPKFSPDGKKIAFVKDNNLWYRDLESNQEVMVTSDGLPNKIKNGWADWVYEEEFSKADYFDWSPNSQFLAFVRFDEERVKEYTMDYFKGDLYPEKYTFKYPKAGEANSLVSVHIYDLVTKKTAKADIGENTDIYIPRIQFSNSASQLCIQRLNRLQNKLEFLFADAGTGKTSLIYTDEAKTYIDITDDLRFVGNKGFIISSERD